jgi:hypothetical protein
MSDSSYPPYPSYPGPTESAGSYQAPPVNVSNQFLSPARGLAIAAASLAALFTLIEVIEAVFAWLAEGDYLDAADRGQSGFEVWTPYDLMVVPYFAAGIAAYVVTCLWLNQVRTNTEILTPAAKHARSKGWIWGGWLVPIVSLWFPFQVVRDIAVNTHENRKGEATLGWWWAFWLMTLISGQIGARIVPVNGIDPDVIRALGPVETINAIITIIALILWLRVIRRITDDQERLIGLARG